MMQRNFAVAALAASASAVSMQASSQAAGDQPSQKAIDRGFYDVESFWGRWTVVMYAQDFNVADADKNGLLNQAEAASFYSSQGYGINNEWAKWTIGLYGKDGEVDFYGIVADFENTDTLAWPGDALSQAAQDATENFSYPMVDSTTELTQAMRDAGFSKLFNDQGYRMQRDTDFDAKRFNASDLDQDGYLDEDEATQFFDGHYFYAYFDNESAASLATRLTSKGKATFVEMRTLRGDHDWASYYDVDPKVYPGDLLDQAGLQAMGIGVTGGVAGGVDNGDDDASSSTSSDSSETPDTDSSDNVDVDDLTDELRDLGFTRTISDLDYYPGLAYKYIIELADESDTGKDGLLDSDEFINFYQEYMDADQAYAKTHAPGEMSSYDSDGDSQLDWLELLRWVKTVTQDYTDVWPGSALPLRFREHLSD